MPEKREKSANKMTVDPNQDENFESPPWTCAQCTLVNAFSDPTCKACGCKSVAFSASQADVLEILICEQVVAVGKEGAAAAAPVHAIDNRQWQDDGR